MSCTLYPKCSAPLCPCDPESMQRGIWYPDEPICRSYEHAGLPLLKQQRKIAKKAKDLDTYYTAAMLSVPCIVRKGMTGIDPDLPEKPQIETWKRNHPPISEETRTIRKLIAAKARMSKRTAPAIQIE